MALRSEPTIAVQQHNLSFIPSTPKKWDVEVFLNEFQTVVTSISNETLEFDLVNIDCTFANAIRRILVAEVPSFAIDRVYLHQNTSVIADEIFCHRIGLVPLNVDGESMEFCSCDLPASDAIEGFDPKCHLIFDMDVKIHQHANEVDGGDPKKEQSFQSTPLYRSVSYFVSLMRSLMTSLIGLRFPVLLLIGFHYLDKKRPLPWRQQTSRGPLMTRYC